jgi:hypothetical protein
MAHADETTALAPGVSRRGAARGVKGFFRVVQSPGGHWSLLNPQDGEFFCKAVHGVRATPPQTDGALPLDSAGRLRKWGFNTLGAAAEAGAEDGLPFMAVVDFCRTGPVIAGAGVRLPDVFAPDWPRLAEERAAAVCTPWMETRELLGWVTDDDLAWAAPSPAGRPSLLQLCLSLEPRFPAYHAAWEFVLALHGGKLDAVARAWNAAIPNKEVVRELTRAEEGLGTRGYLRDEARWTREFARRYFTTTAAAIRAVDPNHLVFGCRFRGPARAADAGHAGGNVLAECVYPAVDVALPDWSELPPMSSPQPVIASDVCWVGEEFLRAPSDGRVRRRTTVERMLQRARSALERLARHPAVVGYAWSQWQDEPGEQPPFARGLVHVNGAEAREHTELLAQFNLRVEALRRAACPSSL